jgi:hypothetical protein
MNMTAIGVLRVEIQIFCDPPRGFGATASIPAHEHTVNTTGKTPTSAANKALAQALASVPRWATSEQVTRRALERRLADWLRTTGAKDSGDALESSTSTRELRRIAVLALREDEATEGQAAAIRLLAEMLDADGLAERFYRRGVEALLDTANPPPSSVIALTALDIAALADGARINVPASPHEQQEIILAGEDFTKAALSALREGRTVEILGKTFTAATAR